MEYGLRDDWEARPSYRPHRHLDPARVTKIFIHHTTGTQKDDIPQWLRSIQSFHMGPQRAWNDIAYSWLVDRNGKIWEGRGNVVGGHTKGHNSTSLAIAYLGDGSGPVPDAALRAIRYQADTLARIYPISTVRGHRDAGATACPGEWLYGWVSSEMPVSRPEPLPTPGRLEAPEGVYRSPVPDLRDGWRRHLARIRRVR